MSPPTMARDAGLPAMLAQLANSPSHEWLASARRLLEAGRSDAAADMLVEASRRWPLDPEIVYANAESSWQRGDSVGAERALRELLSVRPRLRAHALLLARICRTAGRLLAASMAVAEVSQPDANLSSGELVQALQFIKHCRHESIADEIAEAHVAAGRADGAVLASAGNLALELGDFARARARYEAALAAGVDLDVWHVGQALANCQRYVSPDHPDFALLGTLLRRSGLNPRTRASLLCAIGKARDDVGQLAQAVDAFREANAILRDLAGWNAAAWQTFVAQRTSSTLRALAPVAPIEDFVPVFIVGAPRTGTTLVAELLSRHPRVRNRGELAALDYLGRNLLADGRVPTSGELAQAAALYRTLAVQDDAPARWYIDKNPLNLRYLDLVGRLFPNARVIVCRRDPRDTALSLWMQSFAHPDYGFSYDFADIADFLRGADALLSHWRDHIDLPLHVVDYETLVADPDAVIAGARTFVGLPEAEVSASSAASAIQSASVWQARQPIHRLSAGRWHRYAALLPELARFSDAGD